MSVTIRSTDDILAALREHKEWRDTVRRELFAQDLLELPAKFDRAESERKAEARIAEKEREEREKKISESIDKLAEAQRKTDATVQSLAEAQRKTDATLQSLAEAQRKTDATLQSLAEAQRKTDATVQSLAEAQRKTDATLQSLAEAQQKTDATLHSFMEATEKRFSAIETLQEQMLIKLRELDGGIIEIRSVRKLGNYLYNQMDRLEVLDQRTINQATDIALKEGIITREERRRVGAADALAAGEDAETGEPACAAVEASGIVEKDDVDRAADRAALLLRIMQKAVASKPAKFAELFSSPPTKSYALVVGREITDTARREAERKGVLFARYHNGYHPEGG